MTVYRGDAYPAGVPRGRVRRRGGEQPRLPGQAQAERVAPAGGAGRPGPGVPGVDRRLVPAGPVRQRPGRLPVRHRHVPRADRGGRVPASAGAQDRGPVGRDRQGPHLAHRPRGVQAAGPAEAE